MHLSRRHNLSRQFPPLVFEVHGCGGVGVRSALHDVVCSSSDLNFHRQIDTSRERGHRTMWLLVSLPHQT